MIPIYASLFKIGYLLKFALGLSEELAVTLLGNLKEIAENKSYVKDNLDIVQQPPVTKITELPNLIKDTAGEWLVKTLMKDVPSEYQSDFHKYFSQFKRAKNLSVIVDGVHKGIAMASGKSPLLQEFSRKLENLENVNSKSALISGLEKIHQELRTKAIIEDVLPTH